MDNQYDDALHVLWSELEEASEDVHRAIGTDDQPSEEELARAQLALLRSGILAGQPCRIVTAPNMWLLLGHKRGNKEIRASDRQRGMDEDAGDIKYELIDVTTQNSQYGTTVHLIKGMVSEEEANQFFDPSFHTHWMVTDSKESERKQTDDQLLPERHINDSKAQILS